MEHAIHQAPLSLLARPLAPEQILAAAVLAQALRDAQNVQQSACCRDGATAFLLEPDEWFTFWVQVTGLSPELVREQARRCLTRPAMTRRGPLEHADVQPAA